jgi:hypothetical protein
MDFEVVLLNAPQLSHDRATFLAGGDVDGRESTRGREAAGRRKAAPDAIHLVLQSAKFTKRIGAPKRP